MERISFEYAIKRQSIKVNLDDLSSKKWRGRALIRHFHVINCATEGTLLFIRANRTISLGNYLIPGCFTDFSILEISKVDCFIEFIMKLVARLIQFLNKKK